MGWKRVTSHRVNSNAGVDSSLLFRAGLMNKKEPTRFSIRVDSFCIDYFGAKTENFISSP